ncbi:hypothetical protein BWI17_02065 [Betaproteobacteria bacterium GR16-43]|nr:hypothetical protein BWI17_02065 [Betaproteobacteria bacterium GR16-43]
MKSLSRRTRVLLVAAVLLVVIPAAVLGGLYYEFMSRFYPKVSIPAMPAPANRAEANRQDLEVLALLPRYDKSFSLEAADRFGMERQKVVARAAELTPAQMEMEISRLVAIADNGHTTAGRRLRRIERVPIRLAWFAEGLYVVRAAEPQANLLSNRVTSINGKTPEELVAAFAPYLGGPIEHAKATMLVFFVSPTVFAGVWPAMQADRLTFEVVSPAGAKDTISLTSTAPDPEKAYSFPPRDIAPQPIKTEAGSWVSVLSGRNELPLTLRDADASLYTMPLEGNGLYVHILSNSDDERGPLDDQLAKLSATLAPGSLRYAILDMRGNGGGDYTKSLAFTKALPKAVAPDGKLFILTDNGTFSAALVTVARAKYFGGDRSVVLGERVGDRERFWAEAGDPLVLPNSKIRVFFATGYHDWHDGCGWKDRGRCFWINWVFDVPGGDLAPKQPMTWKFADYREGRDTLLEDALKRAK